MSSTKIHKFIENLPTTPGVYRMLDTDGQVLYVGKASNLKKRVSSYFSKLSTNAKTRSLVSQIVSIDISVTQSETEALLLESNLIKSLHPKYNVLMRDDKSYPYILVNINHDYPSMALIRSKKKPKKGLFFGPYPSAGAVRETLNTIQKIFKIRNCSDNYFVARSRPCLQYQIKRCTAPCVNYISKEDYQKAINDAVKFLQGKSLLVIHDFEKRMQEAVAQLAFEKAASLRDQIKKLRLVQEQQAVTQQHGDADTLGIEAYPGFACVQCVTIRNGEVIASESFFPIVPKTSLENDNDLRQEVFAAFVAFYYIDKPERIPALLILDAPIMEADVFASLLSQLRGKRCRIQITPRGIKARWLEFAQENLQVAMAEKHAISTTITKRYEALQRLLNLSQPIKHMECFDISHTQGEQTVASCVVFDASGPSKKDYRLFNITGITPGDDYAAMKQALTRRYKRLTLEKTLPDLLIIDGGKGQVSVARDVLDDLNVENVTLIGIAKGPDRKAGFERLILHNDNKEISLPMDSLALHLLQFIRDEAHRFAIKTHRKKRLKTGFASTLESIEGIGPKRKRALLQRFGGLRELAKAPLAEIAKVKGISEAMALCIFSHFH